jgi:hypothetical protein
MCTQDLRWMRHTLAIVWLVTGTLSLGIYPQQESLQLLYRVGLEGKLALFALYGAALLDVLLGLMTMLHPSRNLWQVQALLVLTYSFIITCYLPEYWLHPFAPILKNLPILMLLWLLHQYEGRTE